MTNGSHTTALKSVKKKKGRLSMCAFSEVHMIWKKQNQGQIIFAQTAGGCKTRQIYMKTVFNYTVTVLGK